MKSNRLISSSNNALITPKVLMGLLVMMFFFTAFNSVVKADIYPFNIRVTQPTNENAFDGSFADGTAAAVRFSTPPSSSTFKAIINIYSGANVVKTITVDTLSGVAHNIAWDGSDNSNQAAPVGSYSVDVTTTINNPVANYGLALDVGDMSVGLSTRGVTVVNDPASKHFGFIYAVNGAGTAGSPWGVAGLTRMNMAGEFAGDVAGSPLVATTGEIIPGTTNRRYSPAVDADGFIYVVSYNEKKILRFHPDTLNVSFFTTDTIPTTGIVIDVKIVGSGAAKEMFVATTTGLYYAQIGNAASYAGPYTTLLLPEAGMTLYSVQIGDNNALYTVVRTALANIQDAVYKFDYSGGYTTKTFADSVWGIHFMDGDAVSLDIRTNGVGSADDILYLSIDKAGAGTVASGIWVITNLNGVPEANIAFADPDNNTTSTRGEAAVDFGGNFVYFENSNEQIFFVENPTSQNTYTIDGLNPINVTASGVVMPPVTIAYINTDANGDYQPDFAGQVFSTIGIVNSVNFTASANRFSYYIQDETGGINITKGSETGGGPVYKKGDRLLVTGTLAYFRGTSQLNLTDLSTDVTLLDTNNVITAVPLTIKQYLANPEKYVGVYIEIKGAGLAPGSPAWPAANADANMLIYDGLNKITLRVDKDADLDDNVAPVFPINVKGVGTQYTSASTIHNDGYQISPSWYVDITPNVATPPTPYFSLLEPADNSVISVTNAAETFTTKWNKAIDFNNDALIYQFVITPALFTTGALTDTTYQLTAAKVLQLMGANPEVTLRWTVKTKGVESTIVSSVDTFTVTFTNNLSTVEDTMSLVHNTGDLQAAIFNMGAIGSYLDADYNPHGVGVSYKGQNGIYTGGLVYGSQALGSVNGSIGSFGIGDLKNVAANFAGGFTTNANFNQISTAVINDAAAPVPYGLDVIQQSYSNTGDNFVFLRYGFINKTAAEVTNFFAGVFADWDIDANTYASNKVGYDPEKHLVYQYDGTKPYYYGLVALNGASGYKGKTGNATRLEMFNFISTPEAVAPTTAGDYRCWIGSKTENIAINDTAWVTFAIVAGDDLNAVKNTSGLAFVKAKAMGWTDITVGVENEDNSVIPAQFFVEQNFPNPFNPSTSIRFGLPQASNVDLRIYNILGQEVAVLINSQNFGAGSYDFNFDASNLSSGTYIYRLQAGENVVSKKMMLVK